MRKASGFGRKLRVRPKGDGDNEMSLALGCSRIESIGQELPDIVWGNHAALEEHLRLLGADAMLAEWLAAATPGAGPT